MIFNDFHIATPFWAGLYGENFFQISTLAMLRRKAKTPSFGGAIFLFWDPDLITVSLPDARGIYFL